jgi:DNA-binding response OmpR family regulator
MEPVMSFMTQHAVRPRVAIYEQHAASRSLMETWLSQAGYDVRKRGGSRATANNPVDLVILATQVSTRQTLELIRTMRAIYPTTAFLVLSSSGRSSSADISTPRVDGARVLSKPLNRERLLDAVHDVKGTVSAGRVRGFQLK